MTATESQHASPAEPDVQLRPATTDDAPALARIHLAARKAAMPPSVHPEPEVRAWLAERIAADETWVAVVDSAPAAYLRMTEGWLDDLYVDPAHQGEGLGSALLDLAKARQPTGFGLWVFEMNAPARAFYARHGLVEVERTDGSDNEEREPDLKAVWGGGGSVGASCHDRPVADVG